MKAPIEEAERVLTKYRCEQQSSVLQALRELHDSDEHAFAGRIRGNEMWGGEGAVWEAYLHYGICPWDEMQRDLRRFRNSILEIAGQMDARGLGTERSRAVAAAVRWWIEMDLGQGGPYVRPSVPPDLEAEVTLVATEHGGRPGPVRSGYRPTHDLGTEIGPCGAQHEYPDDHWLFPGHKARALLWFESPDVHRGQLFRDLVFTIREGRVLAGHGRILRVVNRELERTV